jgi:methanogenic corrinoid protein MtbC1
LSEGILEDVKRAILEYDGEGAIRAVRMATKNRIDPNLVLDAMTASVRIIGDGFGKGELWLPDLIGAAEAMQAAVPIVVEEIKKAKMTRQTLGTVVIGTVQGDVHSIGKTMVSAFLVAEGFNVQDLGVDVKDEKFPEAARDHKADIVCMSALMTTTAPELKNVIELLKRQSMRDRVKVLVGGAGVTEEFAHEIEADGYESTAARGAQLAKKLLGK